MDPENKKNVPRPRKRETERKRLEEQRYVNSIIRNKNQSLTMERMKKINKLHLLKMINIDNCVKKIKK